MKKIIVKADDYGFTHAITDGIIYGCEQRVITCTGLFSNMPTAIYALKRIKAYPEVCLGQDINIVAGYPVSDPRLIPSLVQENGKFNDAQMQRALDKLTDNNDHLVYEECLIEVENQVKRFIELAGKKPEYLQGHSYSTLTLTRAHKEVAAKYGIPYGDDLTRQFNIVRGKSWNIKPFPIEMQLKTDVLEHIISGKTELEKLHDNEVGIIGTHCGYVDQEVFDNSTYTIIRLKDLAGVTNPKFMKWLAENDMELVSYRDLLNK
ncbi:MAG: ChbG/HpnK family deacetylase [Erysipelotrichaceae bacterium]|nr:ChbG/HpnK family deacetylase [Erysipelotrichaceae bacterium]MDD3923827.1 ChbG/HpnK family deacetylase [Erysipelotrichaceae bacterium]MDD4642368.1 ChbG/HpnK family deacetylase [Erysipelotrichaceae bacterium]